MNSNKGMKRFLEIIPGALSWGIIFSLAALAVYSPVVCALVILVFDFYWIIRTVYLTTLLILAHRKLAKEKRKDWLAACRRLPEKRNWQGIYHLILFPVYKEEIGILRASLEALKQTHYPKDKMIVVMAFEERHKPSKLTAKTLQEEFKNEFFEYLTTFHPDGIGGEAATKGANATWAAKHAKESILKNGIPLDSVIVSCFDADTCVDRGYFGCLSHHFLTNPKPHQASYQPIPVYNNNIWYAPSFARVVEISASFCQMIEGMRLEKFVTFSSHSMSFKTLVDIDYWPTDMVSDDSVVYWKAFIFFKGDYRVIPLYATVSMDAAYSSNIFKTIAVQYRQKRRWAWGVENFPFVVSRFMNNPEIGFLIKLRRSFHLLESHVTWAIWAIIIVIIAPLPIFWGGVVFNQLPIGYNLSRLTGLLFNFTLGTSIVWIVLSRTILPPRPKDIRWIKSAFLIVEWIVVPFVILVLGSTPALDAQTRLMMAKYMQFFPTEKTRKVV
jgi:hypothetical protein